MDNEKITRINIFEGLAASAQELIENSHPDDNRRIDMYRSIYSTARHLISNTKNMERNVRIMEHINKTDDVLYKLYKRIGIGE